MQASSEYKIIPLSRIYEGNDYQSFIQNIQKFIPEAASLNGEAQQSLTAPMGLGKQSSGFYGLAESQAIRGFAGLIAFKDAYNGTKEAYLHFTDCQSKAGKPVLSPQAFQQMHEYIHSKIKDEAMLAAITWAILCNDLGQVKAIKSMYEKLGGKQTNHDLILSELLQNAQSNNDIAKHFTRFMSLDKELQKHIILGFGSGCDISQAEETELPIVALEGLKKLDPIAFSLNFIHTIFDVAGAAAHFKLPNGEQPIGSSTMHQDTWSFFNAFRESLELFYSKNASVEEVYNQYLGYRGQYKRDEESKSIGIATDSPENIALIRIICLSRMATLEEADILKQAWKNLDSNLRSVLVEELNTPGNKGKRAIFVAWGVAIINNPQTALVNKSTDKIAARIKGLEIGLTVLAKLYSETRKSIASTNQVAKPYVAFCQPIAKKLSDDPMAALDIDFNFLNATLDDDGLPRRSVFEPRSRKASEVKSTLKIDTSPETLTPLVEPTGRVLTPRTFWNEKAKKGMEFKVSIDIEALTKLLNEKGKDARIVELGCGYGRLLNILHENGYTNISGVDFSKEMIARGCQQFPHLKDRITVGSASETEYKAESADVVLLFNVLTCNLSDEVQSAIIREVKRILKPDGHLYLSDFLISKNPALEEIYKKSATFHGKFGAFEVPGGGLCRDGTPEWFQILLQGFDVIYRREGFTSICGNASAPFQLIGRNVSKLEKIETVEVAKAIEVIKSKGEAVELPRPKF